MKKMVLTIFGLLILIDYVEAYDINSYCRKVSEAVGGSYQIEKTCRDQEHQAQVKINSMSVPKRIKNYCKEVGQAVGGSYQIMQTCIQQEIKAKNSLN